MKDELDAAKGIGYGFLMVFPLWLIAISIAYYVFK